MSSVEVQLYQLSEIKNEGVAIVASMQKGEYYLVVLITSHDHLMRYFRAQLMQWASFVAKHTLTNTRLYQNQPIIIEITARFDLKN